jgi:hypothetical protein
MYPAERPNTCIISNGFASMEIAVPGTVAAKLAYPDRRVVAVTGDAGFMMNSQEIETALRAGTPLVILIWNDSEYGLITWHHYGVSVGPATSPSKILTLSNTPRVSGRRVSSRTDKRSSASAQAGLGRRNHRRDRLPGGLFRKYAADKALQGIGLAGPKAAANDTCLADRFPRGSTAALRPWAR